MSADAVGVALAATPEPKRPWFEPAAAIMMAAASLATAWCSYQSSNWSAVSSGLQASATKLHRQVFAQHIEARQVEAIQTRLWMEAVDAQIDGDDKLARFYVDRFADELKPAYEKWAALKPLENPAAPPHPFVPGIYVPRFHEENRAADGEAVRLEMEASRADDHASAYLNTTVVLATVLFFAGTAGGFDRRRVRVAALIFAFALFAYAASRVVMLPIT